MSCNFNVCKKKRIISIVQVIDFALSDEDQKTINGLNRKYQNDAAPENFNF